MPKSSFTAILEKEGDLYVSLCPELDVASQGATVEEATANLKEAVELFLECADPREIEARQHSEIFEAEQHPGVPPGRKPFAALQALAESAHSAQEACRQSFWVSNCRSGKEALDFIAQTADTEGWK